MSPLRTGPILEPGYVSHVRWTRADKQDLWRKRFTAEPISYREIASTMTAQRTAASLKSKFGHLTSIFRYALMSVEDAEYDPVAINRLAESLEDFQVQEFYDVAALKLSRWQLRDLDSLMQAIRDSTTDEPSDNDLEVYIDFEPEVESNAAARA